MGFWKKLLKGSTQPDKDESVGVDPTTNKKMTSSTSRPDLDELDDARYMGRTEDTKAQRRADPETQEVIRGADHYPKEAEPLARTDSSAVAGEVKPKKTEAEQRKTQPKPATEQKKTPKEAEPGTGKPQAGQHHEKD